MRKKQPYIMLVAMGMFFVLNGCDKKVEITFTNTTDKPLDVSIVGPGEGTGQLGTVAPYAGQLKTKITVDKKLLPAMYQWQAGDDKGNLAIHSKTNKKLYIIVPGGVSTIPYIPRYRPAALSPDTATDEDLLGYTPVYTPTDPVIYSYPVVYDNWPTYYYWPRTYGSYRSNDFNLWIGTGGRYYPRPPHHHYPKPPRPQPKPPRPPRPRR